MARRISRIVLYTPDLKAAEDYYQTLGFRCIGQNRTPNGQPMVELAFQDSSTCLALHSDPLLQFTDIEVEVQDVRDTYRKLSRDPNVTWLREPSSADARWKATVRGPDGNLLVLTSRIQPGDEGSAATEHS